MNKLLIIGGLTATGKTGLGIRLAKKFGGEIISADSRQVYRGMSIGTGKDLPLNVKVKAKSEKLQVKTKKFKILKPYRFKTIPVWMLDVAPPDYFFSVADYIDYAQAVAKDIWRRGKRPVIVGGTGFYIKGLMEGIETIGIKPDWEMRKKFQSCKVSELQRILKEIYPERMQKMNRSDRNNPRRLIRAIEVAIKAKSEKRKAKSHNLKLKAGQSLFVGLKAPNTFLYPQIDKRVEKRLYQGLETEIKNLLKRGYGWDNSALGTTLAYQEWRPLFEVAKLQSDKVSELREEIVQKWKFGEHRYARRQRTWFKKQTGIKWFDVSQTGWQKEVEQLVSRWYNEDKFR